VACASILVAGCAVSGGGIGPPGGGVSLPGGGSSGGGMTGGDSSGGSISLGEQAAGAMSGGGSGGAQSGMGEDGRSAAGEVGGVGSLDAQEVAKRTPDDIEAVIDDDVVAKQIREAALAEEDPELRERYWEEYRKYKGMSSPGD
ncbi:MAG: hypothetical protein MJA32_00235, partial [Proteobacteria bacterium]|nr:hypothetical protein [Pseudomonadota bacterium]